MPYGNESDAAGVARGFNSLGNLMLHYAMMEGQRPVKEAQMALYGANARKSTLEGDETQFKVDALRRWNAAIASGDPAAMNTAALAMVGSGVKEAVPSLAQSRAYQAGVGLAPMYTEDQGRALGLAQGHMATDKTRLTTDYDQFRVGQDFTQEKDVEGIKQAGENSRSAYKVNTEDSRERWKFSNTPDVTLDENGTPVYTPRADAYGRPASDKLNPNKGAGGSSESERNFARLQDLAGKIEAGKPLSRQEVREYNYLRQKVSDPRVMGGPDTGIVQVDTNPMTGFPPVPGEGAGTAPQPPAADPMAAKADALIAKYAPVPASTSAPVAGPAPAAPQGPAGPELPSGVRQLAPPMRGARPLTAENAAKLSMLVTAKGLIPEVERVLKDPRTDAKTLMLANTGPGVSGNLMRYGNQGAQDLNRNTSAVVEGVLRALSGAGVPETEVVRYGSMLRPSAFETRESQLQKLALARAFIDGTEAYMGSTGAVWNAESAQNIMQQAMQAAGAY